MAGLLTDSILLLGEHGQLGRSLVAQCKAADIKLRQWTHDEYPSGRRIPLNEVFALCTPQVIINATAYTQVELAEEEPEQVMAVNRDKVCHLARVAKRMMPSWCIFQPIMCLMAVVCGHGVKRIHLIL